MAQVNDAQNIMMKDFFSKDSHREFINPLASPTTPLHFEAGQLPAHLQQQCFENPWLHNSIQLQLLNYVRTFHDVPQPVDQFSQQVPQYSPPPQHQQPQLVGEQQHPTITLLQQRFQRLERDREMRHAKQLYSNIHHHHHQHHHQHRNHSPEATAANFPSTPGSCSCNLELSLPQGKLMIAGNSPRSDSRRSFSPASPIPLVFIEEKKKTEADSHEIARSSPRRATNFMLPAESDKQFHSYKARPPPPESSSPRAPVKPFHRGETQLLLKEWKSKGSSPAAADDEEEVDTSLHL